MYCAGIRPDATRHPYRGGGYRHTPQAGRLRGTVWRSDASALCDVRKSVYRERGRMGRDVKYGPAKIPN